MRRPARPDSLPLTKLDWGRLVRAVGEANAAVARFDGLVHGIPNPQLFLSPLTTKEAVLSSKIEGTQATLQEVLRFDADGMATPEKRSDILEVRNYRRAMELAEPAIRDQPITSVLIRSIHRELMSGVRGRDKAPGAFRTDQNWIGVPGCSMDEARYVPPSPLDMRDAIENLERYVRRPIDDPLVQAAVVHAQFEIIHPFMDGNGRVGRMLVPLYLLQRGILRFPTLYISEDLEARREEYYDRLLAITESSDWEGWILFFLAALTRQAELNCRRAQRIFELYERMKTAFADVTRSQYAIQALDAAFSLCVFTTSSFAAASKIPKPSAPRLLAELVAHGLLQRVAEGAGRAPSVYAFVALIDLTELS